MSHTVITTTTTTRTSADGILNTGYTRTIPGLLKIGQMLCKRTKDLYVTKLRPAVITYVSCVSRYLELIGLLTGFLVLSYPLSVSEFFQLLATKLALLVAFLCVHCVYGWPSWAAMQFFEVVVLWFLIAFFIFFLMHLFRLQARMPCINWPLTEFFHYSVGTILIFIASIVAAVKSGGVSALVAGSVFGFIATFLMAVSLWTSYTVTCGSHQTGAAV